MINESLQNTIQQHMKKLPEGVQQAIRLSGWERKILDIGRKYGLHVDQMEILQTELSLAILGLSPRDEFVREVKREAGIPTEQLNEIIGDINHQIFEPIRTYLRKSQEEDQTRENTKESLSGLHSTEEDILRSHGFDFDTENTLSTSVSSRGRLPEVRVSQPENTTLKDIPPAQPIVSQPVRLNSSAFAQNTPQNIAMNIQDIMSVGAEYNESSEDESSHGVEASPEKTVETQKIIGEDVDINALRSAKTSEHQKIISTSGISGYQSSDPYREPIE